MEIPKNEDQKVSLCSMVILIFEDLLPLPSVNKLLLNVDETSAVSVPLLTEDSNIFGFLCFDKKGFKPKHFSTEVNFPV